MACIKHIHTMFLIFLALTVCLGIQTTQGRQLKVTSEEKLSHGDDAKRTVSPPDVSRVDSFQPTTPGNSPGVGHSFAGKKQKAEVKVTAGKPDGFQPTTPGHSPGVGHSIGN